MKLKVCFDTQSQIWFESVIQLLYIKKEKSLILEPLNYGHLLDGNQGIAALLMEWVNYAKMANWWPPSVWQYIILFKLLINEFPAWCRLSPD